MSIIAVRPGRPAGPSCPSPSLISASSAWSRGETTGRNQVAHKDLGFSPKLTWRCCGARTRESRVRPGLRAGTASSSLGALLSTLGSLSPLGLRAAGSSWLPPKEDYISVSLLFGDDVGSVLVMVQQEKLSQ